MAYTFGVNQSFGAGTEEEFGQYLRAFMDDMIAAGWRVLGSGDGESPGNFENTGQTAGATGLGAGGGFDILTNTGAGALGWKNQSNNNGASWIRLATPVGAAVYQEYIWQLHYRSGLGDFSRFQVRVSWLGFNGNDATAQLAPTATDARTIIGSRYPADGNTVDVGYGIPMMPSTAGSRCHWIIGDSAEDYDFLFITYRTGQPDGAHTVVGRIALTQLFPHDVADPDPFFYLGGGSFTNGTGIDSFVAHQSPGFCDSRNSSVVSPYKIEDVTPNTCPYGLAYYNKGTPADPRTGWYNMGIFYPTMFDEQHFFDGVREEKSDKFLELPILMVGKRDDSNLFFFKGIAKNKTLSFTSNNLDGQVPQVYETAVGSGKYRCHMGNFSMPWTSDAFVL